MEWYNLAKRYGWRRYFLHDDFYDDDGSATQPESEVERPEDFPAPTLAEVAQDAEALLGYSITRWHVRPDVEAAWGALPRPQILPVLRQKFSATSNAGIRGRVLEICAMALGEFGADFVRSAWSEYSATVDLHPLARASAACLPFREAFQRVTAALALLAGSRLRDQMGGLAYFRSAEVLDWIEQNVFIPITEDWGYLAAVSQLDWPRVERWLEGGRPLSLVALDALADIVSQQSLFTRRYHPTLGRPPTSERLVRALTQIAEQDAVPRVQQRTAWLISRTGSLTARSESV